VNLLEAFQSFQLDLQFRLPLVVALPLLDRLYGRVGRPVRMYKSKHPIEKYNQAVADLEYLAV
jgi:hypothetical protein